MPEQRQVLGDEFRKLCRYADAAHRAADPTISGGSTPFRTCTSASRKLAADLDLGDFLDRANGKLSAGRRPGSLAALINPARIVVAVDEPTASSIHHDTADWIRRHLETIARCMAQPSCWRRQHAGSVD
jgi:hypothetical protein